MKNAGTAHLRVVTMFAILVSLTGCVRRQEEPAAATKDVAVPAELEAEVLEIAEDDFAVAVEVAKPVDAVELRSKASSSIKWVIENGTRVKKGDVLVRLNSNDLEKAVTQVTTESHMARAALVQAEAEVAATELALAEFVEGEFPLLEEEIKVQLLEAELHLRAAKDDDLKATLATAHVKLAQKRLDVLRKFTKPKRTQELSGALNAAKATTQARAEMARLLQSRRDRMLKQLESTVIKAPAAGTVHLADHNGVRSGAKVLEGQVLIYLQEEK